MKKIAVFIFLITAVLAFAKGEVKLGLRGTYEQNAFNLSSDDLDKFDDGDTDFDWIETSDDFIQRLYARAENTFKLANIKLTPYGGGFYDNYTNNNDKNRFGAYAGLRTAFWRLSLSLSYGYYPDNYSRSYEDHNGTHEFEQYVWDTNTYRASGFFKLTKKHYAIFSVTMNDYFYNKYFTEYDGRQMAYEVGLKHSLPQFYLKYGYVFKSFELENDVPANASELDFVRDATYEINQYYLELRSKKIKISKRKFWRPFCKATVEQKFWTTDLNYQIDPIHSGRDDITTTFDFGVELQLIKDVLFTAKYTNVSRKTEAGWTGLDEIKDYTDNKLSFDVEYKFNF